MRGSDDARIKSLGVFKTSSPPDVQFGPLATYLHIHTCTRISESRDGRPGGLIATQYKHVYLTYLLRQPPLDVLSRDIGPPSNRVGKYVWSLSLHSSAHLEGYFLFESSLGVAFVASVECQVIAALRLLGSAFPGNMFADMHAIEYTRTFTDDEWTVLQLSLIHI